MRMSATHALTHKEILQADRDYERAALYAHLVYVSDQQVIKRIRGLVIPPAWGKVWICTVENGHI